MILDRYLCAYASGCVGTVAVTAWLSITMRRGGGGRQLCSCCTIYMCAYNFFVRVCIMVNRFMLRSA